MYNFIFLYFHIICIFRLIEVLRDFAKTDWDIASMVCQILWNYSVKITSTNSCFGEQEAKDLNDVLLELLGKEHYLIITCDYRISAALKVEIDIITSIIASRTGSAVILVIMYVEILKAEVIDLLGDVIMCLISHCPIIDSITVSSLMRHILL